MEKMDKATEGRVLQAVERAICLTKEGGNSSEALLKVATEEHLHPAIVKRMAEAMNVSRTRAHMQSSPAEKRADTFPLVDSNWVIERMYPERVETPSREKAAAWIPDEYNRPETTNFFELREAPSEEPLIKAAEVVEKPRSAWQEAKLLEKKSGMEEAERIAKSDFRSSFFELFKQAQAVALKFRDIYHFNFPEVERRVFAKYGSAGKKMMDMLYTWGGLGDLRQPIKRASLNERETLIWNARQEPYGWIDDLCKRADELQDLVKASVDCEYDLAVFNDTHGFRQAWQAERPPGILDDLIEPPPFSFKSAGSQLDKMISQKGQQAGNITSSVAGAPKPPVVKPPSPPKQVMQAVPPAEYKARVAGRQAQTAPGRAAVAQHSKGGSAEAVPFRKTALEPLSTGMTMGSLAMGLREPPEMSKYREVLADVYDPVHESRLEAVKSKAMINDFLSNDPILSSHDPEAVTNMYNQIAAMAPNAAKQPALMRGLLRKSIQQGGVIEPFEVQQLTQMEKAFKGDTAPSGSPLYAEGKG